MYDCMMNHLCGGVDGATEDLSIPIKVPGLPQSDRCLVMGILNVTPDSFSDGGHFLETTRALERGFALVSEGADIVDVGGESTRPDAYRTPERAELARVLPVVTELSAAGATVSVDTMRASVAAAAIEAGATLINDVSGGLADPDMARVIAEAGVPYIAMHWRAHSAKMSDHAVYENVVGEVIDELRARLDVLISAGIDPGCIIVDPGLGFAKNAAHNWRLLHRLGAFHALGHPVLVGASRKSFLGALLASDGVAAPPFERDAATAAISALAAAGGAYCVRVHDVRSTLDAVRVAAAWTKPDTDDHRTRSRARSSHVSVDVSDTDAGHSPGSANAGENRNPLRMHATTERPRR